MLGQVFNMDGLIEGVQSRGTALLNDLNPFGWVSKELSLIKEFLLMFMAMEYSIVVVSCAICCMD